MRERLSRTAQIFVRLLVFSEPHLQYCCCHRRQHSHRGMICLFLGDSCSVKCPLSCLRVLPKITESLYLLTSVTISIKFSSTNLYGDA